MLQLLENQCGSGVLAPRGTDLKAGMNFMRETQQQTKGLAV